MSSIYYNNFIKRVGIVYMNVLELLEERGVAKELIQRNVVDKSLVERIRRFLIENDSIYIDISLDNGDKKYVVKFINKVASVTRTGRKENLDEVHRKISLTEDVGTKDEIIIVYLDNEFTEGELDTIKEFESDHSNTRILGYKHLMFNITKHELVPPHRLYKGNKFELMDQLMIKSSEQLPYMLHSDPIAKYYNFRKGDIIEIDRPVQATKISKVYRVIK